MKFFSAAVVLWILPSLLNAKVSELNFLPKRGEVFSESVIDSSVSDLKLNFDGSTLESETIQSTFRQIITAGVYNNLALSVELPFLFDGSSKTKIGINTEEVDLSSELRRSVFRVIYHEDFSKSSTLFLNLSYQEAESDMDSSIFSFTPSYRFVSGKSSLLISALIANYTSTDAYESYLRYALAITSQTYFGSSFFVRGSIGLLQDTDQEFKEASFPILFKPEIGLVADFNLGYELKNYNLYFLIGASSLSYDFKPEALGITGDGETSTLSFAFKIGYLL